LHRQTVRSPRADGQSRRAAAPNVCVPGTGPPAGARRRRPEPERCHPRLARRQNRPDEKRVQNRAAAHGKRRTDRLAGRHDAAAVGKRPVHRRQHPDRQHGAPPQKTGRHRPGPVDRDEKRPRLHGGMTMDGWKLFGAYTRQHVWVLAAAAGAAGLFLAVIALYQLPAEAVGYASALAGLFLLAAGVLRFRQFSRRHRTLAALQSQMSVPGVPLPETDDLIERDYQALIRLLDQERGAIVFAKDRAYQEMVDYYTIWAHQIKTPIAAMRLLLQADGEPDRDELAEQLFRIEQYTEMVLQFIRLGGKGTDFVFRAVSL